MEDAECEPVWRESDWGALERTARATESGPTGEFVLSGLPEEWPRGAVLWATHPDHGAATLVLSADRGKWPTPLEIVLPSRLPMLVSVLDSVGSPVAGALVEQHGIAEPLQDNTSTDIGVERARRLFHRTYTTAADGTASAVALAGLQVLVAQRGEERSAPWRGPPTARVTLRLGSTFDLGGTVSLPDFPPDPTRERRIVIAAQTRNLWRDLASMRNVQAGAWGPIAIPLLEADRYRIRLEGAPIVPVEVFFAPPLPRSRVTRDLVAEKGDELWFKVVDERGAVIPTAHVRARWQDQENPDHWRFAEASKTREDQIGIVSVPRGTFEYDAWAPGYVPISYGPFETTICKTSHMRTELPKAGALRGRVLYRGEPVEDFEVLVWRSNDRSSRRPTTFLGRVDGGFELDTVPIGELWVTASSSFTPACEPVAVSCTPGETTEVTLELLDGIRGRGRIVQHGSGEPIPEGAVQVFVRGEDGPVARWGLPIPVEPDGSFEISGFLPGENHVRALAEGYSNQVVMREATVGSTLEWGDLVLALAQDLTLVVEPAERARRSRARAIGAASLPWRDFAEDGRIVYTGTSSGTYAFAIVEADETTTEFEVQLIPGEEWVLRTRLAGENRLSVRAVSEGRDAMTTIDWLRASYVTFDGVRVMRTKVVSGGSVVEFEGIEAPEVTVQLFRDQEPVATGGGTFRNGLLDLEVPIDERSFLVRVVDPSGEPVPDARVTVEAPSHPGLFLAGGTDARGECRLKGVPEGEIRVGLMHGTRGVHLGIPIDASEDQAEIVLEGSARLELAFQDQGTPLGGVSFTLLDDKGWPLVDAYQADERGRATLVYLAPDDYFLRAMRPDCWTVEFKASASPDGSVQTVQLRRLGDLELQVLTLEGLPVTGLAVQLTSLEFGADVADWIRAGRVPPAELVTDALGRIHVARLPRGPYRWRVSGLAAGSAEGTLEVQPAESTPVRISLP